ncbi:MAG: class I SAM-dependent methyltransferase [Actinomycetota bacterium]
MVLGEGRVVEVPPPPDWYRPLAAHLKEAYLRYSFTMGTEAEVDFLWEELELRPGHRLLDVGCGPGRHAVELARRGVQVVGIDISPDFLSVARRRAAEARVAVSFFELDASELPFEEEFDAVISVCEGAFGLGLDDLGILRGMARALRRGRRLAVGAGSVFYMLKHRLGAGELDPVAMLFKEVNEGVFGADGTERTFEMWASVYTPRELSWIANGAGLDPEVVCGVQPGRYGREAPTLEHPELLLIARRP